MRKRRRLRVLAVGQDPDGGVKGPVLIPNQPCMRRDW